MSTDKKRGPRGRRWGRLFVVVCALSIAGVIAYRQMRAPEVPAITVQSKQLIKTIAAVGRIVPPSVIEIGPSQPGIVTSVGTDEGKRVKKGEILVQLDDSELFARKAGVEAALAAARLKVKGIKKVLAPQAQEALRQSELAVAHAEDTLNRVLVLSNAGAADEATLQEARNDLGQAKSRRESAFVKASSVGQGGIDYRLALAELAQAEAAAQEINAKLIDTHITSPTDAVVLKRNVEPGNTVQPGSVLMVLADDSETQALVPIDEKNLSHLEPGKEALVSVDAYPDIHIKATVTAIAPTVDATRGTVDVRLTIPNPPSFLKPDMTASVEIVTAMKPEAVSLPPRAVMGGDSKQPYAWVVKEGRARRSAVTLGLRGDAAIEITFGLGPGDVVLLADGVDLEDGDYVEPVPPDMDSGA